MKNSEIVNLIQQLFESTQQAVNLEEFLGIACEELHLECWEDLAGFLVHLDRTFQDTVVPKLRGCFAMMMRNLKFGPQDWVLIYIRMENAMRLLPYPGSENEVCPQDLGESDAVLWALTTFWNKTYRIEMELVAKRHFGIPCYS